MDGVLLVDKNQGETSFSVVKKIKETVKIRKVGHAGTLDPFATGLLVILMGQGTKLSPYLMAGNKRYRTSIILGVETDTLDPEGRVLCQRNVPEFSMEVIEKITSGFLGEIEQTPPQFSAVHVHGKRAYEFARKGVEVVLKKRKVFIHSLDIIGFHLPELVLDIRCSSGTYIRSLAEDIGNKLGTGAYIKNLRRLDSGSFKVEDAVDSKDIGVSISGEYLKKRLISMSNSLPDIKGISVDPLTARHIRNGNQTKLDEFSNHYLSDDFSGGLLKITMDKSLVAIMEMDRSKKDQWGRRLFKKIRVFN